MIVEEVKKLSHTCHFCGMTTDTFVRDRIEDPVRAGRLLSNRKVPICEDCLKPILHTAANKQTLYFWSIIYPIVKES